MKVLRIHVFCVVLVLGTASACASKSVSDPAEQGSRTVEPPEPATTGNKWVSDGVDHPDGTQCFVLEDEECGDTSAHDYLTYFEAPIFRSGYVAGQVAYATDGTNLWAIDVSRPTLPTRLGVIPGTGRALAITGFGDRLYVASGAEGLVEFSVAAASPVTLQRERTFATEGPAMDVALSADGQNAFVAAGRSLSKFSLAQAPEPTITVPASGFAAGITLEGNLLFVATCNGLSTLNASNLQAYSHLPLVPSPGEAPAPIKDVAVAGGRAFLAAGRWGTFVIDVTDARRPRLVGNKTLASDLLYYANGVATSNGNVYVAAGDWGVDRFAQGAFVPNTTPSSFAKYCVPADDPNRQQAPEFRTVLPPPRRQDPLDVVVAGDALYAMGDASRLGVRAVDIYTLDAGTGEHTLTGRYEEPGLIRSLAAGGGRLAVAGKASGIFEPAAPGLLNKVSALPSGKGSVRVVSLTRSGQLTFLDESGSLFVEGRAEPQADLLAPALTMGDSHLVGVREGGGLALFTVASNAATLSKEVPTAPFRYGVAAAFLGGKLVVASGDWARPWSVDVAGSSPPTALEVESLPRDEMANASSWRKGPPRRLLVPLGDHLVEVASFGDHARGLLYAKDAWTAPRRFGLAPGSYVAGVGEGSKLWLVQGDRARYRTLVTEVDFGDFTSPAPTVISTVLTGCAVGAAKIDSRLYVADADVGIRVFDVGSVGLVALGLFPLEVGP